MDSVRIVYLTLFRPVLREIKRSVQKVAPLILYFRHLKSFASISERSATVDFPFGAPFPCLDDRWEESGQASGHYFHQDLLVAQLIFKDSPTRHVDIGSRVDGFVSHVASFREIEVLDIRPLAVKVQNVTFREFDIMNGDVSEIGLADSVSCLHALEHFGLGRYGDDLDPDGWVRGLEALKSITSDGGLLYLSVPIGPERIEFDAHRVFSISTLLTSFADGLVLEDFYFVDDSGRLNRATVDEVLGEESSFGCSYGCGIFVLRRRTEKITVSEYS